MYHDGASTKSSVSFARLNSVEGPSEEEAQSQHTGTPVYNPSLCLSAVPSLGETLFQLL